MVESSDGGAVVNANAVMAKAYRFPNGMVIAFDRSGDQMPEYQGRYEDVIDKIRIDFPEIVVRDGALR